MFLSSAILGPTSHYVADVVEIKMPTEDCKECTSDEACGGFHLYVIEFNLEVAGEFLEGQYKGYLYVGLTKKSVQERFLDNYRRQGSDEVLYERMEDFTKEGEVVEDALWKYNSKNIKRIRRHYLKHRPDLYYKRNPLSVNSLKEAQHLEGSLADQLKEAGWKVGGPSLQNSSEDEE